MCRVDGREHVSRIRRDTLGVVVDLWHVRRVCVLHAGLKGIELVLGQLIGTVFVDQFQLLLHLLVIDRPRNVAYLIAFVAFQPGSVDRGVVIEGELIADRSLGLEHVPSMLWYFFEGALVVGWHPRWSATIRLSTLVRMLLTGATGCHSGLDCHKRGSLGCLDLEPTIFVCLLLHRETFLLRLHLGNVDAESLIMLHLF